MDASAAGSDNGSRIAFYRSARLRPELTGVVKGGWLVSGRARARARGGELGVRLSPSSFPSGTLKTRVHARNATWRNATHSAHLRLTAPRGIALLNSWRETPGTCKYSFVEWDAQCEVLAYDGRAKFNQAPRFAREPSRDKPCQSRGNASSCQLPLLPDAIQQNNREISVHTIFQSNHFTRKRENR